MYVFAVQLSDGNREIKQAADNALAEFLKEIKEAEVVEFGPMVNILVDQCHSKVLLLLLLLLILYLRKSMHAGTTVTHLPFPGAEVKIFLCHRKSSIVLQRLIG